MTNFPLRLPSPTATLHLTPTEKTQRCVCLTYFHSTVFHFLSLFLRRHGVEERRRTKRNQQRKWKIVIIDFLNVILRLPSYLPSCHTTFQGLSLTHTHEAAPALGRCRCRSHEDFRALQALSHLISLAGVRSHAFSHSFVFNRIKVSSTAALVGRQARVAFQSPCNVDVERPYESN